MRRLWVSAKWRPLALWDPMAKYTAEDDAQHLADVIAARAGDQEAMSRLWELAIEIATHRAKLTVSQYAWLDWDDLTNELILKFPKIIQLFDVNSPNPFSKFVYFSFAFRVKDILRGEDPLGIGFPQKKHYPEWHRLSDGEFEGFDRVSDSEQDSLENAIDAEEAAELEPLFQATVKAESEAKAYMEVLDVISPRPLSKTPTYNRKTRKRKKPVATPNKPRPPHYVKRTFKYSEIKKNSLQKFLRTRIVERVESLPPNQVASSEQFENQPAEQPTAPQTAPNQTSAGPGRGWMKGQKRPAPKKKAAVKKKVAVSKSSPAPTAFDQLTLATRFADSCGGIAKAIQLLTVLQSMKK